MNKISQCYSELYRCMIDKDTVALGRLLDDSFVLMHMTGMRQSKQDFLDSIADGTLNYYSCDDTRLAITVDGENARCTGKSKVGASVFGGGKYIWRLQLDIDYSKKDGRWLIVEARASTY